MSDYPSHLTTILSILDEGQAIDVVVINVAAQTSVTDYMIITSGRSSRHVKALAMQVIEKMKAAGMPALGSHGLESGDWVLVDYGDYVLHIMSNDSRAFYNLEGLWQDPSANNAKN